MPFGTTLFKEFRSAEKGVRQPLEGSGLLSKGISTDAEADLGIRQHPFDLYQQSHLSNLARATASVISQACPRTKMDRLAGPGGVLSPQSVASKSQTPQERMVCRSPPWRMQGTLKVWSGLDGLRSSRLCPSHPQLSVSSSW